MAEGEERMARDNAALMRRFCSLGDNCEFGLVQRFYGAEPLDLMRWAAVGIGPLFRMLSDKLRAIKDPSQISISISGRQYELTHAAYGFRWHAWATPQESEAEPILTRERRRVPFLGEKLLNDLSDGERIFVVKARDAFPAHAEDRIVQAIRSIGPAGVMLVGQGADALSAMDDGVFRASIPRFATPGDVRLDTIDAASWLSLCERAADQHPLPPALRSPEMAINS